MLLAQPPDPAHRDDIPAVIHENDTSRVQTLARDQNPRYYDIIEAFHQRTGVPVVLNTSFNLSGEPIVETPADAIATFCRSGLDTLVLGEYIVEEATI
jgi:carbamoyltransferase